MAAGPAPAACLLIACDQDVVRAGLTTMLGPQSTRVELLDAESREALDPDVVLYDVLRLLDNDTTELEHYSRISKGVVGLSRDLRPDLGLRALAHGAALCVSIGASAEEILEAVESVWRGTAAFTPVESEWVGKTDQLSQRESEVLALITQGLANAEVAELLGLRPNSIKKYVRTAYQKIGATTRPQAVVWAIEHGFTPTSPVPDAPER